MTKFFFIKFLLFQVLCAGVAISLGMIGGLRWESSKYENKFYKNIIIEDVDVGKKTINEAISLVEEQYLNNFLEKNINISLNNKIFSTPVKTFFIDANVEETVRSAFEYAKGLTTLEKYQLLIGPPKKVFDMTLNFDRVALDAFVEDILAQTTQSAQNATLSISKDKTSPDHVEIGVTEHVPSTHIDKGQLVEAIESGLNGKSSLDIDAKPFTIMEEPAITGESLKPIDSMIASYTTVFTPNTGNATNIKISAQTINGTLLMPGDTFSFNGTIGNTTLEKGYTYAPSIINSKYVQDVGGGVCQVSSTLYNTALQAGLDFKSRRPHSKPSTYVPLGLDATISWNSIDYQFENTLGYPLYIEVYTEGNKLYVNMYSNHKLKNTKYKMKSEVYEVLPSPVQYIKDTTLPKGTKQLVQSGEKGYKVKVSREIYEKDVLKDTEIISYDTYKPTPTIYKIGK